jgi:hypothetical protein
MSIRPPAHAIVFSVDEKAQIQALDRTQPGLPMKKGRAGTMTHDYKRHGTTTLFAALDVLEGKVIGRCMQRHRHHEFIRFLNAIEAQVPARKIVHVILDNYEATPTESRSSISGRLKTRHARRRRDAPEWPLRARATMDMPLPSISPSFAIGPI